MLGHQTGRQAVATPTCPAPHSSSQSHTHKTQQRPCHGPPPTIPKKKEKESPAQIHPRKPGKQGT